MKKLLFIFLAIPIVLVLLLLSPMRWKFSKPSGARSAKPEAVAGNVSVTTESSPSSTSSGRRAPLLGETILRDYANSNLPPQNDLTLMSRLMDNSLLLLKSAANRPLSANEDWAALLGGSNAAHERFLPSLHVALNTNGQLVDRWGAPLFFHAIGGGRFDLRSAGPDGRLWTADDIHRNANGSFRHGAELNPESLFDPPKP